MPLASPPSCLVAPRPGRAGLFQVQAPEPLIRSAERLDASSAFHGAFHGAAQDTPSFLDMLAVLIATDPVAIEVARNPTSGPIHFFPGAPGDAPILWAARQAEPLDALTADLAACKRLGLWPRLQPHRLQANRGRHRYGGFQRDRIDILLQPETAIDTISSHVHLSLRRIGRALRGIIAAHRTAPPCRR